MPDGALRPTDAAAAHAWRLLLDDIALYARVINVPDGSVLLAPHGEDSKVAFAVSPSAYADHLVSTQSIDGDLRTLRATPQNILDDIFEELGSRTGTGCR